MSDKPAKRRFSVTVQNGIGDECTVTVSVSKRAIINGAAILIARNRIPDEKPWRIIEVKEG